MFYSNRREDYYYVTDIKSMKHRIFDFVWHTIDLQLFVVSFLVSCEPLK